MTAGLATLVLAAASFHAQPAALTFGKEASAQFEVSGAQGPVTFWASAGQVSPAQAVGPGLYRALFTLPKERFPQVVLARADIQLAGGAEHVWIALPLSANATLKIETKPHAEVNVLLGDKALPKVTADAKGRASVPAVVPPGLAAATVRALDRAGNATSKPLDLQPRPYARVDGVADPVVAAREGTVEVFAVAPDGTFLADAKTLSAHAQRGAAGEVKQVAPGRFLVSYRAPQTLGTGPDVLEVGAGTGWPSAQIKVPLRAGAAVGVKISLSRPDYLAGSGTPVEVHADAVDAFGNPTGATPTVAAPDGQLDPKPYGASLRVADAFAGRNELVIRASLGDLTGESTLRLTPGAPTGAVIGVPHRLLRAGDVGKGEVTLTDAYGNPVTDQRAVAVAASQAGRAEVSEGERGGLSLSYVPADDTPPGPVQLLVRSGDHTLAETDALTVLPYRRPWAIELGALCEAFTNTVQVNDIAPRVSLGLYVGRTNLELVAEAGLLVYQQFSGATTTAQGLTLSGSFSGYTVEAGLRYSHPLSLRWAVHAQGSAGALLYSGRVNEPGGVAQDSPTTFLMRGALGGSYLFGPGRAFAQLELGRALAKGWLEGNLLGGGLSLGYLFTF